MNDIRVVVAVLAGVGIYWFATLVGALGWLGVVCGVLSSNKEALKSFGLRTSKKITLFNGPLECKFHKYGIYQGSMKKNK